MGLFRYGQRPEVLSAAMTGVKLGDRVLFAGTSDVTLVTELATRAGLSGRVVVLAGDGAAAEARVRAIETGGALAEAAHAPLDMLPFEGGSFDVAVAEDTLRALPDASRRGAVAELFRVLRPGGRLLWIERYARGGATRAVFAAKPAPDTAPWEALLTAAGFRGVRTLAAAEGRTYLEGIKANFTGGT